MESWENKSKNNTFGWLRRASIDDDEFDFHVF